MYIAEVVMYRKLYQIEML